MSKSNQNIYADLKTVIDAAIWREGTVLLTEDPVIADLRENKISSLRNIKILSFLGERIADMYF